MTDQNPFVVYTDGSCIGNPGPGAWAFIGEDGTQVCGQAGTKTTNQRMEIMAALMAVSTFVSHDRPLEIVSDSSYVVNCFVDGWYKSWKKNNWRTSAKKPVANKDLWEPLVDLVEQYGNVTFRWVKGHSTDPMNAAVDALANAAAKKAMEAL